MSLLFRISATVNFTQAVSILINELPWGKAKQEIMSHDLGDSRDEKSWGLRRGICVTELRSGVAFILDNHAGGGGGCNISFYCENPNFIFRQCN